MADARLSFTGNEEADRLLAEEPLALLIGFVLDQQIPLTRAFAGPLELQRRLGHLDARRISEMDTDELEGVFREKPALHRFPSSMAKRTADLCSIVVDSYDGDAGSIWRDAATGPELRDRIDALPGFGKMKISSLLAVLSKRLGVSPPGMNKVLPTHPTVGDIDSPESLKAYQDHKRAMKLKARAEREG
jgi:uncharacterized HhH-GPD family protein